MADLSKALLLLEENVLERMRDLTGDSDPELDRQIVQTIREMDENLGFEKAAVQYMEHRDAIEQNKQELKAFVQAHGTDVAEGLLSETDFPATEWRRIVVDSGKAKGDGSPPIAAGINTLANVFEKLETLMKSDRTDGSKVKDLLGEANENLDDTIFTTKEKLDVLSQHLKDDEGATIGGQGRNMNQGELLAALAEVAQELMQPLTAINASLEMMLHGYVGEISEEQADLLGLASNSGEHLKYLMRELIEIVGCPANKGVDSRFHTTSDEVILMQQAS
jgi:signal transduction histidine kinase